MDVDGARHWRGLVSDDGRVNDASRRRHGRADRADGDDERRVVDSAYPVADRDRHHRAVGNSRVRGTLAKDATMTKLFVLAAAFVAGLAALPVALHAQTVDDYEYNLPLCVT